MAFRRRRRRQSRHDCRYFGSTVLGVQVHWIVPALVVSDNTSVSAPAVVMALVGTASKSHGDLVTPGIYLRDILPDDGGRLRQARRSIVGREPNRSVFETKSHIATLAPAAKLKPSDACA